ncbi:hypothetical protein [Spirulina sp. 06S082]|uniref:hypothetical protein n=1 Tax=Spirulina sp. 06S082 TaxID=3110248 RepID=UPI002B1F99F6|nr:hypothetical protein [Spirulina sp. 06S082]MEA5469879.1 hypothetical protein [Spirulina sp. 06S082]
MNASILRQLWILVEQIQATTLLKLSDTELVTRLLKQLRPGHPFSREEEMFWGQYISSKTLLIRDLAETRLT